MLLQEGLHNHFTLIIDQLTTIIPLDTIQQSFSWFTIMVMDITFIMELMDITNIQSMKDHLAKVVVEVLQAL